jgi:hypothetical protein
VPAVRYRLIVDGELGPLYASAFEEMELECAEGKTALVGPVEDQAQLLGLVERVASLGLKLISIAPVDPV